MCAKTSMMTAMADRMDAPMTQCSPLMLAVGDCGCRVVLEEIRVVTVFEVFVSNEPSRDYVLREVVVWGSIWPADRCRGDERVSVE